MHHGALRFGELELKLAGATWWNMKGEILELGGVRTEVRDFFHPSEPLEQVLDGSAVPGLSNLLRIQVSLQRGGGGLVVLAGEAIDDDRSAVQRFIAQDLEPGLLIH